MRGKRELKRSLKSFSKEKVSSKNIYYGELGITLGGSQVVDVPNRDGFVFVRIKGNTSELIQALNTTVPSSYGLPVLIHREGQNYKIIGKDDKVYANQGTQIGGGVYPLPRHGGQHSFAPEYNMGADTVWVFSRQFMPMLAHPSGSSMLLTINPHFYEWNGAWKYAQNTGAISFAPYVPTITGSARMALLYINPTNNSLNVTAGSPFSSTFDTPSEFVSYIPDVDRNISIPLAAVRLVTGTTAISWTDIYDMRDFYTVSKRWEGIGIQDDGVPLGTGTILNFNNNLSASIVNGVVTINAAAGGGGGGGQIGIMGWDEGIPLGTGTILNFVGPNVDASISGSVIRIFVTGSTGGSANPPVTGSVVVQDEAQTLGSVTVLNFVGSGVDVSVSGSVARVHISGTSTGQSWISSEKMIVDNLTPQATGSNTNFNLLYSMVSGTSNLYYNGIRQKITDHYTVGAGLNTIATLFTPASPDTLVAVYEIISSGSFAVGGCTSSYPKIDEMWNDQSKVISGNSFVHSQNTSQRYNTYSRQNPPASGDIIENGFYLVAGVYTFKVLAVKSTDGGIASFSIDGGTSFGTLDFYDGSDQFNQELSISNVPVLTDGYHKLRVTTSGKNVLSSSYSLYITKMWFEPASF